MHVEVFKMRYQEKTFSEISTLFSDKAGISKVAAEKIAQRAMLKVQDEWEGYVE